jgi:tripartite-type tricarboxylate transporter receptor subunit TctC
MNNKKNFKFLRSFILFLIFPFCVLAQDYPNKPIRIIVPFAPGGGVDFMARVISQKLQILNGQQVIVENKGGSGGVIGAEYGVRSLPDGYTLLMISSTYTVSPSLYKLSFNPINDISPIGLIAKGPFIISAHPSLPIKNTKDLILLSKNKPGMINYATSGSGSGVHLATELFLYMANIKMNHVPYKGTGPALVDTISGQTQLIFGSVATTLPIIKSGHLRAIAVTSMSRIQSDLDIPTVSESGLIGYSAFVWQGLIGPKGLQKNIVDKLNSNILNISLQKEMVDKMKSEGLSIDNGTPENFLNLIKKEIKVWQEIVNIAKVKIN